MYGLIRKALFATSPETAHEIALESLRLGNTLGATALRRKPAPLPVNVMGLAFENPVGLSAGMDKNGDYIDALGALGFGFIEIGTITPRPQPGNPKPRVFRLEQAQALINRLGFNNKGVDHLVARVKARTYKGILGINIGKNFDTPIENAADDYLYCLKRVYTHADYITVNISSPNTANLRDLQNAENLDDLLRQINKERRRLHDATGRHVPIALKVAPDLDSSGINAIAEAVSTNQFEAVIATNTTLDRKAVEHLPHGGESGGLSGKPLLERSDQVLTELRNALPAKVSLIGVGGILDGKDAAEKIRLGADLVQFYTGFIYRGPDLINESVSHIRKMGHAS